MDKISLNKKLNLIKMQGGFDEFNKDTENKINKVGGGDEIPNVSPNIDAVAPVVP